MKRSSPVFFALALACAFAAISCDAPHSSVEIRVSGTVLDENGAPVQGAHLNLLAVAEIKSACTGGFYRYMTDVAITTGLDGKYVGAVNLFAEHPENEECRKQVDLSRVFFFVRNLDPQHPEASQLSQTTPQLTNLCGVSGNNRERECDYSVTVDFRVGLPAKQEVCFHPWEVEYKNWGGKGADGIYESWSTPNPATALVSVSTAAGAVLSQEVPRVANDQKVCIRGWVSPAIGNGTQALYFATEAYRP